MLIKLITERDHHYTHLTAARCAVGPVPARRHDDASKQPAVDSRRLDTSALRHRLR